MSTVASTLSIAGSRTSGAPVRTQNGKKFIKKLQTIAQMSANRMAFMALNISHQLHAVKHCANTLKELEQKFQWMLCFKVEISKYY